MSRPTQTCTRLCNPGAPAAGRQPSSWLRNSAEVVDHGPAQEHGLADATIAGRGKGRRTSALGLVADRVSSAGARVALGDLRSARRCRPPRRPPQARGLGSPEDHIGGVGNRGGWERPRWVPRRYRCCCPPPKRCRGWPCPLPRSQDVVSQLGVSYHLEVVLGGLRRRRYPEDQRLGRLRIGPDEALCQ